LRRGPCEFIEGCGRRWQKFFGARMVFHANFRQIQSLSLKEAGKLPTLAFLLEKHSDYIDDIQELYQLIG
jgi:hypothetical protein